MFHVHLPEKGSHDQLSALHGLYTIPTDFNGCLNSSFLPEATIHRSHWGLLPGLHPPRPQQHQLKTLCPLFISSTCDCPFYSTSDTYEKVLSVLPYVEFLFFFFFVCVCVWRGFSATLPQMQSPPLTKTYHLVHKY